MLPPTPHNIILFELDFNIKFLLLRLLQFLSDLKSTIVEDLMWKYLFLFNVVVIHRKWNVCPYSDSIQYNANFPSQWKRGNFKQWKFFVTRTKVVHKNQSQGNRAEMHDLKSRFLLFILLFFFPLFLGGKRKGEKNNQSRDFKDHAFLLDPFDIIKNFVIFLYNSTYTVG